MVELDVAVGFAFWLWDTIGVYGGGLSGVVVVVIGSWKELRSVGDELLMVVGSCWQVSREVSQGGRGMRGAEVPLGEVSLSR